MAAGAVALALGAAALHAVWNLLLARAPDTDAATAVALAVGVALFALPALALWEVDAAAWPYVVAAVLFSGAYLLVLAALRLAEPGPVAAVRETSLVIAAALGALVLHEPVTRARAAGALVVVTGIALIALS